MVQRLPSKRRGGPRVGPPLSLAVLSGAMLAAPAPALSQASQPPTPAQRPSKGGTPDTTPEIRIEATRPDAPAPVHPIEKFDADFIARTDGFTADEVLASVTADLPGTQQIVLIDG